MNWLDRLLAKLRRPRKRRAADTYGPSGWHLERLPHEALSGVPLSHEPDIDAALARGGLKRPAHVPLEVWLAARSE